MATVSRDKKHQWSSDDLPPCEFLVEICYKLKLEANPILRFVWVFKIRERQHIRQHIIKPLKCNNVSSEIPVTIYVKNASGFHLCGYSSQGLPEFWFLSNIGGMPGFKYAHMQQRYHEA